MRKLMALLVTLAMLMFSVGAAAAQTIPSQTPVEPLDGCNYYEETGHNLCGTFLKYWESNGGLPVFGYPITEEYQEVNLDTGETYTVQYFERERFELHPENAGTVYEVLLGRLGNEVLLMQGRDWQSFPKSDPSEPNYVDVTGFAIAPEFIDYWSNHGLNFDEEGYSFRESLALFGYPISQAEVETNGNGHTVVTQWFERARFEFHPDNPEGQQILLGLLGVEVLDTEEPQPEPDFTVVADGLEQPRHVSYGADGAMYVAVAGNGGDECVVVGTDPETGEDFEICIGTSGSILRIADGQATEVATGLPSFLAGEEGVGVHDVAVTEDGEIYAVTGLGLEIDPAVREEIGGTALGFGLLIKIEADGSWTEVADIAGYEVANNPEPALLDSNPYSLIIDGENFIVVDAGGNTLLQVTPEGEITTLAIFPSTMVPAPAFLELPEGTEIPMDAVPTSVEKGPDGAYYVGQLTGFPFPVDGASVWRVMPGGDPEVFAEGFTNISDIAFDGAGSLYVLEMIAGGLLSADPTDPATVASAVTKIATDGTQTTLATNGLLFSTGLAIAADGSIYATNQTVFPGMGQVVLLDETAAGEPAPGPAVEVVAEGLVQPRHISVGGDGALYVAEAGMDGDECVTVTEGEEEFEVCFGLTGGVTQIADGVSAQIASGLPSGNGSGPHDVIVTAEGETYVLFGLGGPPEGRGLFEAEGVAALGTLAKLEDDGSWTVIADLAAFEGANNPETAAIDSNPYAVIMDGENFIVADAGGNSLLQVTPAGEITVLATFSPQMVEAPAFMELPEGTEIPMEAVPTTVTKGPDGAYYVGELTGFPFVVDMARVWRVMPGEEAELYADGFSAIGAIDFDSEGNLYVLEIASGGLLEAEMAGPENPDAAASAVIKVAQDGTQETYLDEGIFFATGLAIDADDTMYIVNFGVVPEMSQVVRVVE